MTTWPWKADEEGVGREGRQQRLMQNVAAAAVFTFNDAKACAAQVAVAVATGKPNLSES